MGGGWSGYPSNRRTGSSLSPFTLDSRAEVDTSAGSMERVDDPGDAYNPLPTLRPTYWAPTYREGDHAGDVEVLNPATGFSPPGRIWWAATPIPSRGPSPVGSGPSMGWASYSYGGLENPILSLAASQSHDAGSSPWAGITEAGDTVPLFLVERERALGLGAAVFRRRSRNQAALSLSASHIWEDRFFLEENLEESDRFRLARPDVRLAERLGLP